MKTILTAFLLAFASATPSALAAPGRAAERDLERGATRARMERQAKLAQDSLKSSRALELAQKLWLPAKTLRAHLALEIDGKRLEHKAAWGALLEQVLARPAKGATHEEATDVYRDADLAAQVTRAFVQLRMLGARGETFRYHAETIGHICKSWSPEQKANFASVLELAVKKLEGREAWTMDQAFERALEEQGRLEEYNKGCKV